MAISVRSASMGTHVRVKYVPLATMFRRFLVALRQFACEHVDEELMHVLKHTADTGAPVVINVRVCKECGSIHSVLDHY